MHFCDQVDIHFFQELPNFGTISHHEFVIALASDHSEQGSSKLFTQGISKSMQCFLNNLENTPSESEKTYNKYKKTADSVLLSLFMRTNGKCNNSHAP